MLLSIKRMEIHKSVDFHPFFCFFSALAALFHIDPGAEAGGFINDLLKSPFDLVWLLLRRQHQITGAGQGCQNGRQTLF